ncbi:MAG TPA: cytochrome c [Phycisphaerae bacterium]|nr:cytochrome c [Phycisphaerae bacterium]
MPKIVTPIIVLLCVLALVPVAVIARARAAKSNLPRIHPIQDMAKQPKFLAQEVNPLFADRRAMRPLVPGVLAQDDLHVDEHLYHGIVNGEWATAFPMPVTDAVMSRGRERFDIFCAQCHGLSGYGDGMTARRAQALMTPGWVQPSSYHTDLVRGRPVGHIFNTITYGIRTMPSYGVQVPVEDRWAIITYVRALERSQDSLMTDVPADVRPSLQQ